MEELSHLRLTSTVKKHKCDFNISPIKGRRLNLDEVVEEYDRQSREIEQQVIVESRIDVPLSRLQIAQEAYRQALGPRGMLAQHISKQSKIRHQESYSVSLISAITQDEVLANQLVEGGVDASVFEHFIFRTLEYVRGQPRFAGRRVVILMDNATIHKHPVVIDCVLAMKAVLLFNPEYSPHLNPIERYFKRLKHQVRQKTISSR